MSQRVTMGTEIAGDFIAIRWQDHQGTHYRLIDPRGNTKAEVNNPETPWAEWKDMMWKDLQRVYSDRFTDPVARSGCQSPATTAQDPGSGAS